MTIDSSSWLLKLGIATQVCLATARSSMAWQANPPSASASSAQATAAARAYGVKSGNAPLVQRIDQNKLVVKVGKVPAGTKGSSTVSGGKVVVTVPSTADGEQIGLIATHELVHVNLGHTPPPKKDYEDWTQAEKDFFGQMNAQLIALRCKRC